MVTDLQSLSERIREGRRISDADALRLFNSDDLIELGRLANGLRERLYGDKTFYIVNRHVDYSNICVLKCRFCAFARKGGDDGSFEFSIEDILAKIRQGQKRGMTEIHMVGGFHPTHPWSFYVNLLRAIRHEFPMIHIKAFTAAEIRYFSRKFRMSERDVLGELMDAGLDSMPGGGAEIFAPRVREEICGPKGPAEYWLATHRLAHQMNLRSTATMLYGHVESIEDRIDHMRRIRDLQDETGGFLAFIPLSFNPEGTAYEGRGLTSGIDDLKTLAVSRLYFDNIPHIKAYWIMSGLETSQMAQYFGADDLHGTVMEENITHMAGARAPEDLPQIRLCEIIKNAGRSPVQRDSLYQEISPIPFNRF